MLTPIKMPNLGTEAISGRIVGWLRSVGDAVAASDVVAEVETEKALVEIEAPVAGTIVEIVRPRGEDVLVGDVLAVIEHD